MLAMLLCLAALGAWKWTHRHDARLVGRWLVTEDVPATPEQFQAATDRTKAVLKTEWTLKSDGAGRANSEAWMGSTVGTVFSNCQWWTNGGRLRIKWGLPRPGWDSFKESADDLYRVLNGDPPQNPVFKYDVVIEGPDLIRIQPGELPWDQSPKVLYLTRLPVDES